MGKKKKKKDCSSKVGHKIKLISFLFFLLLLIQGSSAMSQILVQKLGALEHVSPLLKSPNPTLQKTVMSLLGNMSRTGKVQTSMGKEKYEMMLYVSFAGRSIADINVEVLHIKLMYCMFPMSFLFSKTDAA